MDYLPVLVMMGAGALIGTGGIVVSQLLGPRIKNVMKDSPFECGVPPVGGTQQRVSVRFYLVAILFLLFDVEMVFFYPWALVFKKFLLASPVILISMATFVVVLVVGYLYVLGKRALEWE